MIGALLSGEAGDKAVFKTGGMYRFEFVRWRPDVLKAKGKYGYIPVVFEAKAEKVGSNFKLADIKYLISVTPWASQIEVIK